MALTITLSNTSGASYIFSKILQFQLKKEVYTPYTTFSAQFQTDGLKKFGTICKVIVQNGSQVVHEGTVETLTVQTNASVTTISLLSYGFTKLLLHSELAPGLYPNLSINRLLSISTGNYMGIQQRFHQLRLFQRAYSCLGWRCDAML